MAKTDFNKLHKGKLSDPLIYSEDDTTPFTGLATSWYKNGQVKFEGRYKKGVLNGKATWWHSNGQKEHEATYINGKLASLCADSESKE